MYSPPTNDPSAPSRFSQVAHLKEYLQLNIKVLQDQIDWNSHKINSDELLRDQGTSMTPKMQIERGTNTERDSLLEGTHEDETRFCFHCLTHGHKVYRCTKPGKERAIAWLHQQESIIDYGKKQKQKHQPTNCDVQRLDTIATTRRLTNPNGKDWQEKEMLFHEKQHKEISKDISQEAKRGTTTNSSSQITPNSHSTQFDKFKTNTLQDESEKRSPGHDPQYTGQTLLNKGLVIPGSHKRVFEQTSQSYSEVAPENNSAITGDQLPLNNARVMSTRQLCDNREEAFYYKTHNYTPGQTQFDNKVSTPESSILKDPQLPISPTNIRLGTPNKENKKNVQFWTPENN